MQFSEALRAELMSLFAWRRDVRRFQRDPLADGTLERLVRIASLAPSVGLSEPWRFVSVDEPRRRATVRDSFLRCNADALAAQESHRAGLYARLKLAGLDDAPCQFALFSDHTTRKGGHLGRNTMPETIDYSAVLAAHTLWLAARAEGLGLGWVSIIEPEAVSAALEVPTTWRFIGYFCLGAPTEESISPTLERQKWEMRGDPGSILIRR